MRNEKSEDIFYITNDKNILYFQIGMINNKFVCNPQISLDARNAAVESVDKIVKRINWGIENNEIKDEKGNYIGFESIDESIVTILNPALGIIKIDETDKKLTDKNVRSAIEQTSSQFAPGDIVYTTTIFYDDIIHLQKWASPGLDVASHFNLQKFTVVAAYDTTRKELNEILAPLVTDIDGHKTFVEGIEDEYGQKIKELEEEKAQELAKIEEHYKTVIQIVKDKKEEKIEDLGEPPIIKLANKMREYFSNKNQ